MIAHYNWVWLSEGRVQLWSITHQASVATIIILLKMHDLVQSLVHSSHPLCNYGNSVTTAKYSWKGRHNWQIAVYLYLVQSFHYYFSSTVHGKGKMLHCVSFDERRLLVLPICDRVYFKKWNETKYFIHYINVIADSL